MEFGNTTISYNFEFPICEAGEDCEEGWECPEELTRLLAHESKAIQPQEPIELVNLGNEEETDRPTTRVLRRICLVISRYDRFIY